jgi:hypothetical protein
MTDLSKFNINDFNNLIKTANESISCGPSCMSQKQGQQLQQNFLDAESNLVSAPDKLFKAKKDLITYTQGESSYNTYIDNELQKKAETIVNTFQTKFNKDVTSITNNVKNYEGILINFDNIFDLYNKYKSENNELEKKLKITASDTLTNDRKSYYEDEGLIKLRNYYYFFLFVYIFILIVFILSIFLVKTNVKIMTRIFILILLIIYPFICYWLVVLLHKLFTHVNTYIPKNVYTKL